MSESAAPVIDVLLATWNGTAYLRPLLDSVLGQGRVRVRVIAHDDHSTDASAALLDEYATDCPGQVSIVRSDSRQGVVGSFNRLLECSTAPYVAFCDQDDIWLVEKLAILVDRARELEVAHGRRTPILVHSDLEVVDRDLQRISESFVRHSGIDPARNHLGPLLLRNTVTGCACLFNRALVDAAAPVPADALMHDYWFALVAAAIGAIGFIDRPLVQYRQHGGNTLGAKRSRVRDSLAKALALARPGGRVERAARMSAHYARFRAQARALLVRLDGRLGAEQRALIEGFASLDQQGWLSRRLFLVRHDVLFAEPLRNLGWLLDA
jgi:glycosyltransferase involved in cell wall biosynthesis